MLDTHSMWIVAVAALVTACTRFLPFLVFGASKEPPAFITYLGKVLPCAVMGMLVVYCMKDVSVLTAPYGIPEIISCVVVAVLHIWKRNSLLSIGCGTAFYMILLQFMS